jgi:hypothetical protein
VARKQNRDAIANEFQQERDDHFLPPRRTVHPTEKAKWIRIFYRTLLWLFVSLVIGLIIWGARRVIE